MKILIFNVKYSENLGDGLLADCLETALCNLAPDITVETIDIAGRTAFGTTSPHRGLAVKLLHRLPAFARRSVVKHMLAGKLAQLSQQVSSRLATADAAVIGGGNLLQDDDLNFPLKIGTVLDCLARSRVPVAIQSVGVSKTWSPEASRLFARVAGTNLVSVSVRDAISLRNWQRHFPDGPPARITADPGLLARHLPAASAGPIEAIAPCIGICVTEPVILLRHASLAGSQIALKTVQEYRELVNALAQDGYHVRLFSNGAREDQALAEQIMADPGMESLKTKQLLSLAPRPVRPEDLMSILRTTDAIVAHRLHACIAAYSLGVPPVGLDWDQKVSGFFASVGREKYCLSGSHVRIHHIVTAVRDALKNGLDAREHSNAVAAAEQGIRSTFLLLKHQQTSAESPAPGASLVAAKALEGSKA